jgi:hypothetical protein
VLSQQSFSSSFFFIQARFESVGIHGEIHDVKNALAAEEEKNSMKPRP